MSCSRILLGLAISSIFVPASAQQVNTSPPKSIWNVDGDGVAVHLQSSLQCPNASGDFKRNQLALYDKVGFDVSCNFRNSGTGDVITVYLTRRPAALLQKTFESAKDAVTKFNPTAKPREDALVVPGDVEWLQAGFIEKDRAAHSDLLMTSLHGWEFQIRATYNPDDVLKVTAAIADLESKVMSSAGTHLAACSATSPPSRAGRPARGEKLMPLLVISGAAQAAQAMSVTDNGDVWCAEFGIDMRDQSYLDWRNVAPGKNVVERITGPDGELRLALVSDSAGAEVAKKTAPEISLAGGVYVVVGNGKDQMSIDEIYAGWPPIGEIAKFLSGAHPVFASISKIDKKILIYAWAASPPP